MASTLAQLVGLVGLNSSGVGNVGLQVLSTSTFDWSVSGDQTLYTPPASANTSQVIPVMFVMRDANGSHSQGSGPFLLYLYISVNGVRDVAQIAYNPGYDINQPYAVMAFPQQYIGTAMPASITAATYSPIATSQTVKIDSIGYVVSP